MKKNVLTSAVIGVMAGLVFNGCSSPSQKVEDAKENLNEAKQEQKQAQQDSINDYQQFKKEAEQKIESNEQSIAALKEKTAKEKKATKEKYDKKIEALEQKNSDLRTRIGNYDYSYKQQDAKEKWETFKRDFNHDMDEIGNSLHDFFTSDK